MQKYLCHASVSLVSGGLNPFLKWCKTYKNTSHRVFIFSGSRLGERIISKMCNYAHIRLSFCDLVNKCLNNIKVHVSPAAIQWCWHGATVCLKNMRLLSLHFFLENDHSRHIVGQEWELCEETTV